MDVEVILAGAERFDEWDAFVESHPQGTLYHKATWLLAGPHPNTGLIIARDQADTPLGGFAFAVNTRNGLRRILKPALTARFGPLVAPHLSDAEKSLVLDKLLAALPAHDLIGLSSTDIHDSLLLKSVLGASERRYPTNFKTFPDTPDELLASYQSNIRRNIRNALNEGGRFVEESDPDLAYELFVGAYQTRGDAPRFSKAYFSEVIDHLSLFGNVTLPGVIDQNGMLVASLLLFYDSKRAFYVVSGTDREALNGNAGALLVHFALRFAQDRNLLFDFNGSSITGINGFFEKFGPDPAEVVHLRSARTIKGKMALLYESVTGRHVI
jgi:lipid II:glycine glycyltransferase (peptidoglycan interpeptide bridge formation enzyme)